MRVLLQSRTTLFSVPGGDTIQVIKTMQYLRRVGCHARISTELEPDLSTCDLVHIFNVTRPQETYLQALNAKRQGKKVALSTIYVSYQEFDQRARGGVLGQLSNWLTASQIEYLKVIGRAVHNGEFNRGTRTVLRYGHGRLVAETIRAADILLPNSVSELNRLCRMYPEARSKQAIVVPNGVDPILFGDNNVAIPPELQGFRDCVLTVARIEGLKCQLQLVRAMRGLPWKLVLIGASTPNHAEYYKQVLKEAVPNVRVIGRVEHHKLAPFYRAARVHTLVSWMETTGLSSLEAAAMGKNIVITNRGDTREYFGDLAYYCEPDSVSSIRDAIVRAFHAEPDPRLRRKVLENYTWPKTAAKTMQAYTIALGMTPPGRPAVLQLPNPGFATTVPDVTQTF